MGRTAEQTLDSWLDSRVAARRRVAILFGAGISIDPPTCLPSGATLLRSIINCIALQDEESSALLQYYAQVDRADRRDPDDYLRLERVLHVLAEHHADSLSLLEFFSYDYEPNRNHYVLAILAACGNLLLTTNFDHQVEIAAQHLNLPLSVHITDTHYRRFFEGGDSAHLLKLHGDALFDRDASPSSRSVAATLFDVDQQNVLRTSLKWRVVATTFSNCDLLVLGYSGADDLDLIPLLCELPCRQRILWIQHSNKLARWPSTRFDRQAVDGSGAYLQPFLNVVKKLKEQRAADRVTLLEMPTSRVIGAFVSRLRRMETRGLVTLAESLLERHAAGHEDVREEMEIGLLRSCFKGLEPLVGRDKLIAADMLLSLGRADDGDRLLTKYSGGDVAVDEAITRCLAASRVLRRYGLRDKCMLHLRRAAALAPFGGWVNKDAIDEERRAVAVDLGVAASVAYKLYPSVDARPSLKETHIALLVRKDDVGRLAARGLDHLERGQRFRARWKLLRAMHRCRRLGDEIAEATVRFHLALTYKGKNWKRVQSGLDEALAVYEKHRIFHEWAFMRGRVALEQLQAGQYAMAEKNLSESLRVGLLIRHKPSMAIAHQGLATILAGKGQHESAYLHALKARSLFEDIGATIDQNATETLVRFLDETIPGTTRRRLQEQTKQELELLNRKSQKSS